MKGKNRKGRFQIPAAVREHMAGVEIYTDSDWYHRNPSDIRKRAIEDAQFLLDVNFDGYEDFARTASSVRRFVVRAKQYEAEAN